MSGDSLKRVNSFGTSAEYYLMNKDEVLAKFNSVEINGKPVFSLDVSSVKSLPPKFTSLEKFLDSRTVITQRSEVLANLSALGLNNRFEILLANYGVSLVDTLWVKSTHDKMSWSIVSPYNKKSVFDISWFLTTSKAQALNKCQYRPEYSTDGTFPKCWITRGGSHTLLKCGTSGTYNAGLEPFSEAYALQVAEIMCKSGGYVKYDLTTIDYSDYKKTYKMNSFLKEEFDGKVSDTLRFATMCDSFTSEESGFVSAAELGLNNYQGVWDYAKNLGDGEVRKVAELLLLDCLIVNVDRHLGNIGFLYDNDTFEVKSLSPVFDNNLSLLCYWVESLDGSAIDYAKTCYSKLGIAFDTLGKGILAEFPEYREELKQIANYFEFCQEGFYNFKTARLESLSSVVREQARCIL